MAEYCPSFWLVPLILLPCSQVHLCFFSIHSLLSLHSASLLSTFSHEQETWVDFHHCGPILVYQEVFAILKEVLVFLYTFDMKLFDLILYKADCWPTTIGNNFSWQHTLLQSLWGSRRGHSEHHLGEGAQPGVPVLTSKLPAFLMRNEASVSPGRGEGDILKLRRELYKPAAWPHYPDCCFIAILCTQLKKCWM